MLDRGDVPDDDVFWITSVCGGPTVLRKTAKSQIDGGAIAVEVPIADVGQFAYAEFGYTALDSDTVYWVSASRMRKIAKTFPGSGSTLIADVDSSVAGFFRAIAVDDRVYARLGDAIVAVDKSGGIPTMIATGLGGTRGHCGLIVAGENLYFTAPEKGIVGRVSKLGGAIAVIAADQKRPLGLAVDASYVYWSNAGDGTLWRARR